MSSNRLAASLIIALVMLWQPAFSGATKSDKFRVLTNTGERFVVYSGRFTSDSLIGTSYNGADRSVPLRSIGSLDRATGTHAKEGAGIGALAGTVLLLVSVMHTKADADRSGEKYETDKIPLKLFGFIAGCGLLGVAIGSSIDAWEPAPWSPVVSGRADSGGLRLKLSLRF